MRLPIPLLLPCLRRALPAALLVLSLADAVPARAQDAPGATDVAPVSRYRGSRLMAWQDDSYVSASVPLAWERKGDEWLKRVAFEGQRQRRMYRAPDGRTALEVQRNYEAAMTQAGYQRVLACTGTTCASQASKLQVEIADWLGNNNVHNHHQDRAWDIINRSELVHASVWRLGTGAQAAWVMLWSGEGSPDGVGTVIDILTPAAMQAGQVSLIDAAAIGQGLQAAGRLAFYGLYFDTGKAELRPDSRPQLAEMAAALKAQPALKVYIVGHTDNQGALDANLALSQKRAEAVVAALVKDHGIAAARLQARGVASLAPLASNMADEGRGRNRRVEMVLQ